MDKFDELWDLLVETILKEPEMAATKNHDGSLTISTLHKGYRVHKLFYGYTKTEAKVLFRQWLKRSDN